MSVAAAASSKAVRKLICKLEDAYALEARIVAEMLGVLLEAHEDDDNLLDAALGSLDELIGWAEMAKKELGKPQ